MNTEQERAEFEAWCKRNEYDHVQRLDGTGYNNEATKRAWQAWQARAAIEADRKRGGEPVAYRLLRKNADGEWVTDGRPWCDGVPDADLAKDSETSGQYRIEYAFAAPQPAETVLYTSQKALDLASRSDAVINVGLTRVPQMSWNVPLYTAPQPAEPVKKKPYAQGSALGEFGIIPMCDQVNDEPVKVPSKLSNAEILSLAYDVGAMPEQATDATLVRFARALLARYGKGTP